MYKIEQLNLRYKEFNLELNSEPGWEVVPKFVSALIEQNMQFESWVYEWAPAEGYYVFSKKFGNENAYAFEVMLRELIIKDCICILKIGVETPISQLLRSYTQFSEGTISDNRKSAVFPAPIEVKEWAAIDKDEFALVIHHDGEPLFILTGV